MILRFLHWLASHPAVYDWIQAAAGAHGVRLRMAAQIAREQSERWVLDLGGGTGKFHGYWGPTARYICLDLEFPKLAGFRKKIPGGLALQADATGLPFASATIDAVLCTAVAHHLPENALEQVLRECSRALKPGGRFLFIDPLSRPDRRMSRILWRLDRGAYPYTADRLRQILGKHFHILHWERFSVYHEYVLAVMRNKACKSGCGD